MSRCPDCGQPTSGIGRCPVCRVERNHAGVDHDHEVERICVGCDEYAPDGSYSDERRGMWFCTDCSSLELTRTEREQLAAESTPVGTDLDRAVRWAVGDADAYPESDPGECAFVDGNDPRLIADGGRVRRHLYLITEHEEDEYVGSVKCTETRIASAKKNEERPIRTFEPNEGFYIAGKQVALGYVDFESEEELEEEISDEMKRKLTEVDREWLKKAFDEPEKALPEGVSV